MAPILPHPNTMADTQTQTPAAPATATEPKTTAPRQKKERHTFMVHHPESFASMGK